MAASSPSRACRPAAIVSSFRTRAWIDAVQDNARLPILELDRSADCPGVRQSLQVDVTSQPLVLQVSSAPGRFINIAVRRVWEFQWRW